jgi:hypothetical protein
MDRGWKIFSSIFRLIWPNVCGPMSAAPTSTGAGNPTTAHPRARFWLVSAPVETRITPLWFNRDEDRPSGPVCPVSVDAKGERSEQRTMAVRTPTATASLTLPRPGSLSKKEPLRHSPWP